jgi:glycosyltransferase involved in cell wall biosynthesis
VVVPTRDRWNLAKHAVRSALGQQEVELEVCVIDDGSVRRAPSDFPDDPRVRLFRHETSQGVAASRNHGIGEARAEWIAFLDDDDIWSPSHLRLLLDAVRASGARWGFSGFVAATLGRRLIGPGPVPAVEADVVRQFLRVNPVGTPSCALVEAEALRRLGGFDEALSVMADWDLWVRLAGDGKPALVREFTVAYALHPAGMSLDADRVQAELAYLTARYAAELERAGLRFGDNEYFWRWLARAYAHRHRRRLAIRYFIRAARAGGGRRDVVRAVTVVPVLGWPIRLGRTLRAFLQLGSRRYRSLVADYAWLQAFPALDPPDSSSGERRLGLISQRRRVRTRPSP